jgi:hypothetical protein
MIMNYKVIPISTDITSEVRSTLVSPQYKSLKANVSVADGYGPCRSCLRVFDQGRDSRIYFTYNSFDGRADLPAPGPVFIHENECKEFAGEGIPQDLLNLPVLFEAFGTGSSLISRQAMDSDDADEQIRSIFTNEEVRFINMRNAEAGCFIATIERS